MSLSDAPQVMDAQGRIKLAVDILSSVLPTGASTAAHQVTMITALELIDNLIAALASVNTDALIVAGVDIGDVARDLLVDAARHLQVDIVASALPTGAATAAHQVTQNTALQLIDDLYNALQSVNTDALIVAGVDIGDTARDLLVDAARHLQVDIVASALPTGAATAAHQVTQNTALQLIDNLVTALASVNTDSLVVGGSDAGGAALELLQDAARHLQVDVVASGLPTGAATAANQATMITALQLIDNLVGALGGPGLVRLDVRGEDQLFSFESVLGVSRAGAISGADGYLDSDAVPAGEIWVVSHVFAIDVTNPTTRHNYIFRHDAADIFYHTEIAAFGAGVPSDQFCKVLMDEDDVIRVEFIGGLVGDACRVRLVGYRMTVET